MAWQTPSGATEVAAMAYTLAAAAKAAGRDKTTVLRAIKAGKLSGARDPVTGSWMVEPAELHRFYGTAALATADATAQRGDAKARHDDATAELRARLAEGRAYRRVARNERRPTAPA